MTGSNEVMVAEMLQSEYVFLGIRWRDRGPMLHLVDPECGEPREVSFLQEPFAFEVSSTVRMCTGRYEISRAGSLSFVPCEGVHEAVMSNQCEQCHARDDFRHAHQVHRGGHASAVLQKYMRQPHWLYIATFADSVSKVGTVVDFRKDARLDEQGPVLATYVALAATGTVVRHLEDALSGALGLTQFRSRAAKLAAASAPAATVQIQREHEEVLTAARRLLDGILPQAEAQSVNEKWKPPQATLPVWNVASGRSRRAYPLALQSGHHGFTPRGCAGSIILDVTRNDGTEFLVDIGALRGLRLRFGEYAPRKIEIQATLF